MSADPWFRACLGHVEDGCHDIPGESVDVVVTSPPYKKKDGYHPALMEGLGRLLGRTLRPGGRVFLNFGQLREGFARPFDARLLVATSSGLHAGQTIAWVKSIAIDGKQRGHYQPLNSKKVLNYAWEPVFTFFKPPELDLDRLSIGVPFADKGNLRRGTRGRHGDLHCAGDAWFIPYSTTGQKTKKKHAHEFPEELVERCLKVSGVPQGGVVLEPFIGSGTTVCVAKRLGLHAYGVDRDADACRRAHDRWDGEGVHVPGDLFASDLAGRGET